MAILHRSPLGASWPLFHLLLDRAPHLAEWDPRGSAMGALSSVRWATVQHRAACYWRSTTNLPTQYPRMPPKTASDAKCLLSVIREAKSTVANPYAAQRTHLCCG